MNTLPRPMRRARFVRNVLPTLAVAALCASPPSVAHEPHRALPEAVRAFGPGIELTLGDEARARVETVSIVRGSVSLPLAGDLAARGGDGTQGFERATGAVEERIDALAGGLEQSWRFARRPAGEGALRVRVRVGGVRFARADGRGLHFAAAAGGRGLSYGHGTWVDARGARTEVPARFEDGYVALEIPSGVVDHAAYPAVLDPTLSPEVAIVPPPSPVADLSVGMPRASWDGSAFAIAFTSTRGVSVRHFGAGGMSADAFQGTLLSPAQRPPAVASAPDGTTLVAWSDGDNGVFARRVDGTGNALDPAPVQLSAEPMPTTPEGIPRVAEGAGEFLVVWSNTNGPTPTVRARRVRLDGTLPDAAPVDLAPGPTPDPPAAAFDGTRFLVAWAHGDAFSRNGIFGAYVDPTTGATTAATRLVAPRNTNAHGPYSPALAGNGAGALLAWGDATTQGSIITYGLQYALVDAAGAVGGITVVPGAGVRSVDGWTIDAAYDGPEYTLLAEQTPVGPAFVHVNTAGGVTDSVTALPSDPANPYFDAIAVAGGGGEALVTFDKLASPPSNSPASGAVATRVTASGVLDDPAFPIAQVVPSVRPSGIASDGTGYLTAWIGADNTLVAARLDATGALVGAPIELSSTPTAIYFDYASIAFNGTNYLVVWSDRRNQTGSTGQSTVYAARVAPDGTLLDPGGIRLGITTSAEDAPGVASDGTNWLVLWLDRRAGRLARDIYGTTVTAAGVADSPGGVLYSVNDVYYSPPAVVWDGRAYDVVWLGTDGTNGGEVLRRFDATGAALGGPVVLAPSVQAEEGQRAASAVSTAGALFAWIDDVPGMPYLHQVHAARVAQDGTVLDPGGFLVADAPGDSGAVAATALQVRAASDGANYLLAWTDVVAMPSLPTFEAARVGTSGAPVVDAPFSLGSAFIELPIAANAPGVFFTVYEARNVRTAAGEPRDRFICLDGVACPGVSPADAGVDASVDVVVADTGAGSDASSAQDSGVADDATAMRDAATDVAVVDVVVADVVATDVAATDVAATDVAANDVVATDVATVDVTRDAAANDAGGRDATVADADGGDTEMGHGGCNARGRAGDTMTALFAVALALTARSRRRGTG